MNKNNKNVSSQDILIPLFMVQIPEKTLARRGLKAKDWQYVVESTSNVNIKESNMLNAFISLEAYRQIMLTGMRFFGAQGQVKHYINDIRPHHFGPIGTAIVTSPSLRDSLNILQQFHPVTSPMLQLNIRKTNQEVILKFQTVIHLEDIQETFTELALLTIRKLLVSINHDAANMKVCFSHNASNTIDYYQQTFGFTPCFSSNSYSLILQEKWLDHVNEESSPFLYQQALKECHLVKNNISSNTTIWQRVYQILMESYHLHQRCTLERAAERLNMSDRSLSRKLQLENISFREIQSKVRIEKAKRDLKETNLSIKHICYNTGFTNLSSFSRSFRKNTQFTPTEYRLKFSQESAK